MHNELLTGKVMHRISTAGGCPIGISQGGIIGKLSHRPFSAGRANKLGEGGFGDAVKHAARASADRVCARQRNIWRKLILIRGLGWIRRWLGIGGERAVPDGGRAATKRAGRRGKAKADEYVIGVPFHVGLSILFCTDPDN